MFSSVGQGGYVAEKAEGDTGWMFPVGDEIGALGYVEMFLDMFNSMDAGKAPMETFYDGYLVNAVMDACYRSAQSKRWEPVDLPEWRGGAGPAESVALKDHDARHYLIKEEVMPNGATKLILKDKASGEISQIVRE